MKVMKRLTMTKVRTELVIQNLGTMKKVKTSFLKITFMVDVGTLQRHQMRCLWRQCEERDKKKKEFFEKKNGSSAHAC